MAVFMSSFRRSGMEAAPGAAAAAANPRGAHGGCWQGAKLLFLHDDDPAGCQAVPHDATHWQRGRMQAEEKALLTERAAVEVRERTAILACGAADAGTQRPAILRPLWRVPLLP
jgi:hypothetical protein